MPLPSEASFLRRVVLAISTGEKPTIFTTEGLRIQFDIDKAPGDLGHRGLIRVTNLSPENRKALARPYSPSTLLADPLTTVFLFAGYTPIRQPPIMMFAGDVLRTTHERRGSDWVTEIEAMTAIGALSRANTSLNFSQPTRPIDIVDALLKPMLLFVNYTKDARADLMASDRVESYSYSGPSFAEAREFVAKYGIEISFSGRGGAGVLVHRTFEDKDLRFTDTAITPKTGLIGTPKITRQGIELRCFLRPDIQIMEGIGVVSATLQESINSAPGIVKSSPMVLPGDPEELAAEVRGLVIFEYIVQRVRHSGDNRGNEWYTDITAHYAGLKDSIYPGIAPIPVVEPRLTLHPLEQSMGAP